jgi:hypothetical protein
MIASAVPQPSSAAIAAAAARTGPGPVQGDHVQPNRPRRADELPRHRDPDLVPGRQRPPRERDERVDVTPAAGRHEHQAHRGMRDLHACVLAELPALIDRWQEARSTDPDGRS